MKKITAYAMAALFLVSCSKREYSFTENGITRHGHATVRRHIEVITVRPVHRDSTAYLVSK